MSRTAERHYNYSSSAIYRLMANGKAKGSIGAPFDTYVKEKIREKRLGKPIDKEQESRSTLWGHFAERWAFEKLGLEYHLQSKDRYLHDELAWSGAPDMITKTKVCDIKCPWTLNSFCEIVDNLTEATGVDRILTLKKHHKEYYWQLVSNSILTGKDRCELIIYCPYEKDLLKMQNYIGTAGLDQVEDENLWKYKWIYDKNLEELPCLSEDQTYYKDLYIFGFTPPESDKIALYERVKLADGLLKAAA